MTFLRDAGLHAEVGRLDYNLPLLTIGLQDVTLSAEGSDTPFFSTDAVRLDLPWSIVTGRAAIQALEVDRPRIVVVRREDGSLNLPEIAAAEPEADEPAPPLEPLRIDRLVVRELEVRYGDASWPLSVDGRGVTLDLDGSGDGRLTGRLTMSDGVTVLAGEHETTMSTLEGAVAFDGTSLTVDALTLEAPEARIRLDGTVGLLADEQRIDARFEGRLDARRIAPWVALEPTPGGHVSFSGTARGALTEPDVTLDVTSEGLAWSTLGGLSLQARATMSGSTVTLESFETTLAGGAVSGDAHVYLGDTGSSRVRARFENVNLGTLASVAPDLPVMLASIAVGDLSLEWSGQDLTTAHGAFNARLRAPPSQNGALALAGAIDLELARGTWTLSLDQRVAETISVRGDAAGRLAADNPPASTIGGHASLEVGSLEVALQRLHAAGLVTDQQLAQRVRGALSANLDLGGSFEAPLASGTLNASELWLDGTGPGSAYARLDVSRRQVTIDPLTVDIGPNALNGDLSIGLDTNTLSGTVTAALREIAPLAVTLPAEWRPTGSAELDARLGGTLDNPAVSFTLSSRDLQVAGQTMRTARSKGQLANQILTIEELELTQDDGRLTATARYDIASEQYVFSAAGNGISIAPLITSIADDPHGASTIPLAARFDLRIDGEGTVASPQVRGFVQFSQLDWDRYQFGSARADLLLENGSARLMVGVPEVGATLRADVSLEAPRPFTFEAALADLRLSELVRVSGPAGPGAPEEPGILAPGAITGALNLRATGSGQLDALADVTVDLDLRLVDMAINGAPLRLARPARLRYAGSTVIADDLELRLGSSTLTARGALGGTGDAGQGLEVQMTGALADFVPFVRLLPATEAFDASGAITMQLRATGSFEAPDVAAEFAVTEGSLATEALPPVTGVSLRASYAKGLFELSELAGAWQSATVTASGTLPAALFGDALPDGYRTSLPDHGRTARVTVRVESITPDLMAPFVDQQTLAQITGHIDVVVDAETEMLDLDGVRGEVTLTRAEIELARVPLRQTVPTRLRLAEKRLEVVEWNWSGAGNRLGVAGGVSLEEESPRLGMRVTGALDLRLLGAFVPDIATAGRAILDVEASGPANDPVVDGQLILNDGSMIVREPRFAITDLDGTVTLTRDRLQLRDVTASANGGTLEVRGEVSYPDFTLANGTIAVSGRGLAFEIPDDLRTEVNADLEVTLAEDAPRLTGRVTVLRGSYREPISLAGQLLTGVEVVAAAPVETEPSLVDRIQLEIAVVSEEDILVDNNYSRLEVGANLKVIGTLGQPVLAGRLTVLEGGEVYLSGQRWEIARGTVDFTNATQIEPDIDLEIETRVQSYDITLAVRGTPGRLETSLQSPGVSQADVVSLLLTGQRAQADSPMVETEIARGQLVMLLSGELLGFAGRAVGLDSVQVSRGLGGAASDFDLLATNADPGARLTLIKELSRDVEIVYSQSLRESGAITWIAIYRPLEGLEFRGTTEDDDSRAYEFRHELHFGGGVAPRSSRDRRTREERSRIVDIRFTGTPGVAEAELRNRIRLSEGDGFDFHDWQQDQDRLAGFYHERDYLEVQIRARRRGADGDASLSLEYEIERGPLTKLVINGFDVPGQLVEEMKVAWSRAVFDGFLLEDLETMTRRVLADQAYLQASVKAAVTSPSESETKEITVVIAPGPRFDDQEIVFSGNERVSTGALETVVRSRGLGVTAWLSPADLENALEQYYRSLGSLAADVTVDQPVFAGQSATLPVRIDEGQPFRIASVTVQGVAARPESELLETFGIAPGAPYEPSELQPARRAVEVAYLSDGYNDVRVSVPTRVDRDRSQVDISLNVVEGRQQIVEEIDIRGAAVTSRGTIERAVNLRPGQPADLTDAYRAQKRLYDTGAFRSADVTFEPAEGASADRGDVELVRALVELQELPRYRFRYGFRLNDAVGPVEADRQVRPALVVDLFRRNLFGRAVSTGIAGQLEADRRLARGIVSVPRFFGLPVTSSLFLTASREEFAPENFAFIEDLSRLTAEQRFLPARNMTVSYSYSFERNHVFQVDPPSSGIATDFVTKIARLTGTYAWDTRDDPANARRGWFHSSGLEYGPEALGSDLRFIKYLAQQYHFATLGEDVVLASAFRLGVGRGFGQNLLPSERFLAGGGTTVRGFAEEGLGSRDFFGDLVGGNGLLLLNQEVRFPVFKWIRGVGFIDAGNVFARASDLSFTGLEAGTGLGLRIDSPFALLRVDFGVPLTRRQREPDGRWYFGIGQTF